MRIPDADDSIASSASRLVIPASRGSRYGLALLASATGALALALLPGPLRSAPFFPAAVVSLLSVLVLGIGPAILAQSVMLLATLVALLAPGNALATPLGSFGSALARTVALFALVDAVAWVLERGRRAAAARERALWESETRYRHLLEQASDGIVLALPEGRLILANQRICEMLGYSEAELLQLPITALYADGELEQAPLVWEELARTPVVLRERELRRKDGSTLRAELSVRRTADGFAQAIVRDITERRRAEEAMRAEHALLESILATSMAGILVVTPEGRLVFLNPTAEAALGITKDQLADRNEMPPGWRLLTLEGEPLPDGERPARRVMATGAPVRDARLMVERADGRRRILSVNAAPLRDGARRITAVVLSLSDITEQQLAQQAIEEREEQLQRITAAVPGVVYQFVVSAEGVGRFAFVSERAEQLFGVPAAAIMEDAGRLRAVVAPADYGAMTASFRQAARAREPWSYDFRVAAGSGQPRWLRAIATASPGRDAGSVVWFGVVVNITEQKRLEEELRQSQKMDSLGRLAGGVAHDFNNLLTVIRGYADVLAGELGPEDPRRAEVREIRGAADRATSLTRQLLAMSRHQVLVPREVDLNALVREMERMLRRVIGEHIAIGTALGTEPAWVRADPGQLEQVLLNLAVNARDAMPAGGTLSIGVGALLLTSHQETPPVRGVPPGDYVVLSVADTGIGMDRETQGKIFEPFFTTKPIGEGTGLGLSTVYGIVQQSSGAVTVESEPGNGTTFRVLLPRISQGAKSLVESAGPPAAGRSLSRRAKVLLVDDDDHVRQLTGRMLEQSGYEVEALRDGTEAHARLAAGPRDLDAVVSDVMMSGLTGTELLAWLRVSQPDLPVLLLSGYTEADLDAAIRRDPSCAFLQKPFSADALVTALEELLADARPPATAV